MQNIRLKLVDLGSKNADTSFLSDVKTKAEELVTEYNEVTANFILEHEKLSQICFLNDKVSNSMWLCF